MQSIMKIVSADEMRAIDRATGARFGVPSLTLMEDAGAAVAEFVLSHYSAATRVAVFCGKGTMAAMAWWRPEGCMRKARRFG